MNTSSNELDPKAKEMLSKVTPMAVPRFKPRPPREDLASPLRTLGESAGKAADILNAVSAKPAAGVQPAVKKPPYVRPEHLYDRPFKEHAGLAALKEELDKTVPASKKQGRSRAEQKSRTNNPAGKQRKN